MVDVKQKLLILLLKFLASEQLSWGFPYSILIPCPDNASKFCCSQNLCHPPTLALELCHELPAKADWSPYFPTFLQSITLDCSCMQRLLSLKVYSFLELFFHVPTTDTSSSSADISCRRLTVGFVV